MPAPPLIPTVMGANWRITHTNLAVNAALRVYQNLTRDIDGTTHQYEDLDIFNIVFDSFLPMDGDQLRIVRTTGNAVANGTSLQATYTIAKTLTPNGVARSATNRVTILLPAGVYDLGTTPLALDASAIDFCGLGNREDVIITSQVLASGQGTVYQTVNDVLFQNLTIQNTAQTIVSTDDTDASGYSVNGSFALTIFNNCYLAGAFNVAWPMRLEQTYSGRFENCRFGSRAFRSCTGVGTVRHCDFADNPVIYSSGTGVFEGCAFNDGAFEGNTGSFKIRNSTFGANCFYVATANPTTCVVENSTFGDNTYWNSGRAGICRNCTFGTGTFFQNGAALGTFISCDFNGPTAGGVNTAFGGVLEGCRWLMDDIAFKVGDRVTLWNTTIITTADPAIVSNAGAIDASIAHCRFTAAIDPLITNLVTPNSYNVISTAIQ